MLASAQAPRPDAPKRLHRISSLSGNSNAYAAVIPVSTELPVPIALSQEGANLSHPVDHNPGKNRQPDRHADAAYVCDLIHSVLAILVARSGKKGDQAMDPSLPKARDIEALTWSTDGRLG